MPRDNVGRPDMGMDRIETAGLASAADNMAGKFYFEYGMDLARTMRSDSGECALFGISSCTSEIYYERSNTTLQRKPLVEVGVSRREHRLCVIKGQRDIVGIECVCH